MISENDKVIIVKDDCYKVIIVHANETINFEKFKFSLNALIGNKYEDSFSINLNQLIKIDKKSTIESYEKVKIEELNQNDEERDNRNINGSHLNQTISAKELTEMKIQGETGDEILDKLIKNNKTFELKTKFAQEKYLKKKKKLYLPVVTVHRVTSRKLCQLYEARSKLKILNLRLDSLCQIVSMSNAHHGVRVLLAETVNGLLLGAMLERGANVANFYHGSAPVLPELCSQWSDYEDRVFNLPLQQLAPLARQGRLIQHRLKVGDSDVNSGEETVMKRRRLNEEDMVARRQEKEQRRQLAAQFVASGPLDALVVATKFEPRDIVEEGLCLLAPGKPVVVYSQFLQTLVELYDWLVSIGCLTGLRITETVLTGLQVLPDRTHPHMSTSGTGGYILSGVKLLLEQ